MPVSAFAICSLIPVRRRVHRALNRAVTALYRWIAVVLLGTCATAATATAQTLILESWRPEDQVLWDKTLLPAFEQGHPGIRVRFAPTVRVLYDQALTTRLERRMAGDLISCRPFDAAQRLFRQGHLVPLDGLPALNQFPANALRAWQTEDGRHTYCLPVASVTHGIFYNRALFRHLRLTPPRDEAAWLDAMARLRDIPGLTPLAFGTADRWEAHQLLFTTLGPSRWEGEAGRQRLLAGKARLTDPPFVDTWALMERLTDYMPPDYMTLGYEEAMDIFGRGAAGMRPGGSWEIQALRRYRWLDLDAFPPPAVQAGTPCQVTDHMDLGIGINPASPNVQAARVFLDWLASPAFSQLYANAAIGFYPLSKHPVTIRDPLAERMRQWRQQCQTTIRLNADQINGDDSGMEEAFWNAGAMVMDHHLSPAQAAARLQRRLDQQRAQERPPRRPGNDRATAP